MLKFLQNVAKTDGIGSTTVQIIFQTMDSVKYQTMVALAKKRMRPRGMTSSCYIVKEIQT